jgi:hypothetical protein
MISINSKSIPNHRIPLSVTPYGSGNTLDMIEMPLNQWSTISSRKPCWSLCIPWNTSLIHKHHIIFPLSRDTRSCPRLDHRYIHIVFTLVTDKSFYSFSWYCILHDLVTRLQASYMQLSSSGPRVSICHTDGQILPLVHTHQHTPLAYPRDTFLVILLR